MAMDQWKAALAQRDNVITRLDNRNLYLTALAEILMSEVRDIYGLSELPEAIPDLKTVLKVAREAHVAAEEPEPIQELRSVERLADESDGDGADASDGGPTDNLEAKVKERGWTLGFLRRKIKDPVE